MPKIVVQNVRRLKNPGENGIIFVIHEKDFGFFDDEIAGRNDIIKPAQKVVRNLAPVIRNPHNIGGIEIFYNNGTKRFIMIEPKGNKHYIVSNFFNDNEISDFAAKMVFMEREMKIKFEDKTPGVSELIFQNFADFIISIYWYAYYKKIDRKAKNLRYVIKSDEIPEIKPEDLPECCFKYWQGK